MKLGQGTKFAVLGLALIVGIATAYAQSESAVPAVPADNGGMTGSSASKETADALLDPNLYIGIQEAYQNKTAIRKPDVMPQDLKTIFFTVWQHRLIQEQRRIGVMTGGATQSELESASNAPERRPDVRELSLGGIVYADANDWVVWLNSQRVTPDAIPRQVIDIQVRKDYIELKWFDSWTNLIYPIRLRPHQRFNLDSRIFLPGVGTSPL